MKQLLTAGVAVLLAACATSKYAPPSDETVRDYIAAGELTEKRRIRTSGQSGWSYVNDRFIIFRGRDQDFLLELRRDCPELRRPGVIADVRRDASNIWARADTISGCIIKKMYAINEGQSIELKALGEGPGDRN